MGKLEAWGNESDPTNRTLEPNTRLMSRPRSDTFSLWDMFRKCGPSGKAGLLLSTWFGTGLVPYAPGTAGTLAAMPLVPLLEKLGTCSRSLALAILLALAIWSAGRSRELLGQEDPAEVVIDEVTGFLVATIFLPLSVPVLVLGFILFRFFDILKPYPIKRLERLRGGFGIVMDDVLAGLYALAGTKILLFFF